LPLIVEVTFRNNEKLVAADVGEADSAPEEARWRLDIGGNGEILCNV
jgi:hypothetical protein